MSLRNKKILVTGAGGFIGRHLVDKLLGHNVQVRVLIRYNSRGRRGWLDSIRQTVEKDVEIYAGDLKDADGVRRAIKGCDIVFHLGALISIPYSYVDPANYVQTNIGGTLNILNASLEYGVQKVVHTSTSEVYGSARYVPIDEGHPLQAQSPYSATKISADKLAESYFLSFGLPVAILRPFNTYGPRQSARAVIPTIISQVLSLKEIQLGSLDTVRDFLFVDDTVNGFMMAAEADNSAGHVINVGTGKGITIGELAQKIISLTGKDVKIVEDKKRVRPSSSEVRQLICDNSRARNLLGWEARIPLEEGLTRTIEWISAHLDVFTPEIYSI